MYSSHKKQNLIKPMMVVFTDGYIEELFSGPIQQIKMNC